MNRNPLQRGVAFACLIVALALHLLFSESSNMMLRQAVGITGAVLFGACLVLLRGNPKHYTQMMRSKSGMGYLLMAAVFAAIAWALVLPISLQTQQWLFMGPVIALTTFPIQLYLIFLRANGPKSS